MPPGDSFAERYNLRAVKPATVREEAPARTRGGIFRIASTSGLKPFQLRRILCKRLLIKENHQIVEEHKILAEIEAMLEECVWYRVYCFTEDVYVELATRNAALANDYAKAINSYFGETGIGWEIQDGNLHIRGGAGFEEAVRSANHALEHTGRLKAQEELRESIADISRLPEADITGAIQHAMAALECVARDLVGDTQITLGKLVKRYPNLMPTTLAVVVDKAYGFASDEARHLKEGKSIDFSEAELVVSLSATLITYLLRLEHRKNSK
jgi:hypothetical protein